MRLTDGLSMRVYFSGKGGSIRLLWEILMDIAREGGRKAEIETNRSQAT